MYTTGVSILALRLDVVLSCKPAPEQRIQYAVNSAYVLSRTLILSAFSAVYITNSSSCRAHDHAILGMLTCADFVRERGEDAIIMLPLLTFRRPRFKR